MDDGPRNCSVARTLEVVGDRWSLLVIREALLGAHRFDQMQRGTGAPRDILAARLRKLVETGVLERRRYQERPPRFEYHLTEAGRDQVADGQSIASTARDRVAAGGYGSARLREFLDGGGAVTEVRTVPGLPDQ